MLDGFLVSFNGHLVQQCCRLCLQAQLSVRNFLHTASSVVNIDMSSYYLIAASQQWCPTAFRADLCTAVELIWLSAT